MDKTKLLERIQEQEEKIKHLHNFEKNMDFLDDEECVEMYKVLNDEENLLTTLKSQLEANENNVSKM